MKFIKGNYALLLMKKGAIVQIRTINCDQKSAIEQAMVIKNMSQNKFDNVMVYKTVDHIEIGDTK